MDDIVRKIGGSQTTLDVIAQKPVAAHIVINTTPVSSPDDSPEFTQFLHTQQFRDCELIFDLNYDRQNNIWQKKAKELGVPFIDGLHPLAHAARRTLLLWTRVDVEPSEFLKALELK